MSQIPMTPVHVAYGAFFLMTLFAFFRWRGDLALCLTMLGGWILLPVAAEPQYVQTEGLPHWIIGLALPSDLKLTKSAVIGASALVASLLFRWDDWRQLRHTFWDLPILIWCLCPLAGLADSPATALAGLRYQLATWGALWLLGRVHLRTDNSRALLLRALAWSTACCLPLALLEGVLGLQIYGLLLSPHPFGLDGTTRYLFSRPIGMFEHGNQYGIWVSLGALCAFVAWRLEFRGRWTKVLAIMTGVIALAAQSVGAVVLGLSCLVAWSLSQRVRLSRLLLAGVVIGAIVSTVYLSGRLPLQHFAKHTSLGQQIVEVFRRIDRGSFTWRIAQDQKALPLLKEHPLIGHQKWDWWRESGTRPWGLVLLTIGQFGLIGAAALLAALLTPVVGTLMRLPKTVPERVAAALALVILATFLDALLNSFVYHPAILIAGSLASMLSDRPPGESAATWQWADTRPSIP